MRVQYCLPIIHSSKKKILETIRADWEEYHYFEVWIDYVDNLDDTFIKTLERSLEERLIIVFRRRNLETMRLKLDRRLRIIDTLHKCKSFIDLDVFQHKRELSHIKNHALEINSIVSYHNYQMTPGDETLMSVIDAMDEHKPTIYKIATMCASESDVIRLLQLILKLQDRNVKYILLGMGKFGIVTRIVGTLWGNEMIFAPKVTKERSAPGQITKSQLKTIFSILKD